MTVSTQYLSYIIILAKNNKLMNSIAIRRNSMFAYIELIVMFIIGYKTRSKRVTL